MSVAPRAAPSMSERSRMLSRRGSHQEEEELAVGAVVVMLSDKTEDQNAAAYRLPNADGGRDDAKLISSGSTLKDQSFMAVLAPSCDTAMASLLSQPPGTYLLVKEEDATITVYVKFRQAVRALTLVKGKDVKKNDDAIQLAKLRKKDLDVLMQTPVHNLRLSSEAYFLVEHCWKRFLPEVQAVVFELCCEPHLDEETKLEDWSPSMIPSSAYSLGLMPEACGFYILATPGSNADSSSSTVIQVRQVEFDFNKFAITVADGTLKPSALLLATYFSAKRTFEPYFTFSAIRDNFLMPDQVMLKETSVNVIPSQQSSLQNCIDLSSNDKEFAVLSAAEAACGAIMPHEPFPDSFLTVLHEMHVFFVNAAARDAATAFVKPASWSAQKMKLVGRIIPILLELLIASAAFSESSGSAEQVQLHAVAAENKKRQTLAQFSQAMRFDILFMTARSDDSVLCRLTHQFCQLLGARIRLPSELVDIIRDLVALFPVFLRLFMRNQGTVTLWRNLHHNDLNKDAAPDTRAGKSFRSFRALTSSTTMVNALQGKSDRKLLLFGLARKSQTKSRKSLSLGMSFMSTPFLSSKALAFFRLSPLSVQVYLGMQLREGYFTFPDVRNEDAVLARIAFCSCSGRQFGESKSLSQATTTELACVCARKRLRSSPKMITYEFLLQLSLRFLYDKTSFVSWDRDVALLLRLEDIHQHIFTEIIGIVRRQAEAQDINTRDALACELRVAIACVSTFFRLERKRRLEIRTAVGDKRYLAFIHSFRTKLRELNERLQVDASCDEHTDEFEEEGSRAVGADDHFLLALAKIFKWIPKAFLDEWIVLSLKELLQLVDDLSKVTQQTVIPLFKKLQYVRYIYELFKVLAVVLKRTSDPDIQTMLVRVLSMDCAATISLLRYVLSDQSLRLNGGHDAVCIQLHVLNFLSAFVNLDIALPVQIEWGSSNRKPSEEDTTNEDADVIEQLKGELLIRLLGPRMVEDGGQNDQSLSDFMLELIFPHIGTNAVASFNATSRMVGIAIAFRSVSTPPIMLTAIARGHFQMKEAFLNLQQALYTAQDTGSSIDYEQCVASHVRRIEQYCDRIIENTADEDPNMVYRMVELNLRCLIVLASRRSQFPAIQEAFNRAHVLSFILQRLQPQQPTKHDADSISARSQRENSRSVSSDEVGTASLPPLKLPQQPSLEISDVHTGVTKLSLSASPAVGEVHTTHNFLLAEPGLHALAIVLVATYTIVDPNLELDEAVCPRISVPDRVEGDLKSPSELLWTLQRHLAAVAMGQRYLEALMLEMETLQGFVSTARLSAVRSLLRLLCPNRFDCNLYVAQDSQQAREYIAKGAFSTVYRQHPTLPQPESVAVKVVEHQRRTGEMCAVSGLFNEVSILSKLRGDLAATQLVDFGNHHAEQSFEIVMEYCPCSLTEWRATITETPFRSCLLMILRAFEEACRCLTRVHRAGVCHFDIKSDNILVRSSAHELTRKILENEDVREADVRTRDFTGWLCFADFGESKVVGSDSIPLRTLTFSSLSSGNASPIVAQQQADRFMSLTRTRGTEAIKSPEVLKIKGSEEGEVKITLASDIWSLGCLLYELVTQELLFQNDDWAGLYAHLVVTQEQDVLRCDHKLKLFEALKPTSREEEAVVTTLTELCSKVLSREPTRRPTLKSIATQVHKLVGDVHELPVTASDESFITSLYQSGEASSPQAQRPVFPLRSFVSITHSQQAEAHGVIVPVRFFWNFFIAAHVTRTQDVPIVTSCVTSSSGPASKDVLVMEAFEATYEAAFVHFVYLSWHEGSMSSEDPSVHEGSRFIQELHEEDHRTCFLLHPSVETSDLHLFQQLVQHAPQYFPVLQRRLREEAGRVVFVTLGRDGDAIKALQRVVMAMLLFFQRSALQIPALDVLSYFARDCAQFFDYPGPEFLQLLVAYSTAKVEDTGTSTIVQCRCGSSVFAVESSAYTEALTSQQCTCQVSTDDCMCFHPFMRPQESSEDSDDELFPVDAMFGHDSYEKQLVLPLETRAKQGDEVKWLSLDVVSVSRVESSAFCWASTHKTSGAASPPAASSDRRISRFSKLTRRASKVAGEGTSEPQELVRGLQRRRMPQDEDAWELYECELCRLPICAMGQGKAALPVLHPHSND